MSGDDLVNGFIKSIKVTGTATVLHKPGAVRLDDYPHLCYAPTQWGAGVRTENNGTLVADIVAACAEAGGGDFQPIADRFGVTLDHVQDALRYAIATKFAEGDVDATHIPE